MIFCLPLMLTDVAEWTRDWMGGIRRDQMWLNGPTCLAEGGRGKLCLPCHVIHHVVNTDHMCTGTL